MKTPTNQIQSPSNGDHNTWLKKFDKWSHANSDLRTTDRLVKKAAGMLDRKGVRALEVAKAKSIVGQQGLEHVKTFQRSLGSVMAISGLGRLSTAKFVLDWAVVEVDKHRLSSQPDYAYNVRQPDKSLETRLSFQSSLLTRVS